MWLKETAEYLEKRSIRVYSVSVCSTEPVSIDSLRIELFIMNSDHIYANVKFPLNQASLEEVSKTTHGKMFKSTEINKLVKMTQNTVLQGYLSHFSKKI